MAKKRKAAFGESEKPMTDTEWGRWAARLKGIKLSPDDIFGYQILIVVVRYALNIGPHNLNRALLERMMRHAEQGKSFRSFKTVAKAHRAARKA